MRVGGVFVFFILLSFCISFQSGLSAESRANALEACRSGLAAAEARPFRLATSPLHRKGIRTITNYNRTRQELEAFVLFAMAVAGKDANNITKAIELFLGNSDEPFKLIRRRVWAGTFASSLVASRMGKYRLLGSGFIEIAFSGIDLGAATPDELERFTSISFKTSRFFILHSQENARVAALDRHILRWMNDRPHLVAKMKEQGVEPREVTPSSKRVYLVLEKIFLDEADRLGVGYADLDYQIWLEQRSREAPEQD